MYPIFYIIFKKPQEVHIFFYLSEILQFREFMEFAKDT